MKERILTLARDYNNDNISIRRHLHMYPELSFREFETSAYILGRLKEYGIPFQKGFVKTGIIGIIEGRKGNGEKTVALRADMDGLPIREQNYVPYKSKNDGVMHACGHDAHTACLLTAGRILNDLKDHIEGRILLIFQPGEEKLPGGAKLMIEEGIFKDYKPDLVIGQHVLPQLETGKVGFREGKYMASTDEIYMHVFGRGGHGALPQDNIDPILTASHIIIALQQIISRNADPLMPSVLSFGKFLAEGATNVIPNKAYIEGTFRTFNEKWRKEAHGKMKKMAESIAGGMGARCEFNVVNGYPFVNNDPKVTKQAGYFAEEFLGTGRVEELDMRMTSEDFAYFSQKFPSTFYRLGTGNHKKGSLSPLHSSTFDIDEDALLIGSSVLAWLGYSFLKS
ncbi:MAG: M20 family metallopeptidase [Bacteroidales bacterium]